MEYIKINSLWKRQEYVKDKPKGTHGPLIVGEYSEPEFGNIKKWYVEEKVDGTNIRIFWGRELAMDGKTWVKFGGRTADAQIPCHLLDYLQNTFTPELIDRVFPWDKSTSGIMFGEGYGPKIQACGGNYRNDVGFILFDVKVGDWWLKREDVKSIAEALSIPMVPYLGIMTEYEIEEFVKSKPLSQCSHVPQMMEGIVARSEPLMLFRNGKPVIFKLKCKEFT